MYIRIYDKQSKQYYKSIVYGLINSGYYQQAIVVNPYANCFTLVDYLDKTTKKLVPVYEVINNNQDEWVFIEKAYLLKFKKYCKDNGFDADISLYRGYAEVYEDFGFLLNILKQGNVLLSETSIKIRTNHDINDWNYIRTQKDADQFMGLFVGFHDSTMDFLSYEEQYKKQQLIVRFDNSGWYGIAELCFEGLIALNLRPPSENYNREIYEATLIIKDESVFWADGYMECEDLCYEGTYVKALNLKWRKV